MPFEFPSDAVVLDQVAAAGADEANTEVVVGADGRRRCAQRRRTDGTVAAEEIVHDVIVVAVDEAVPPTRSPTRIGGVPDRDDSFDEAVCHASGQQPAETIVMRRDVLHRDVGADTSRSDDEDAVRLNFCTMPGPMICTPG